MILLDFDTKITAFMKYPGSNHIPPEKLPGWARWIAQDADGAWWAFEVEPLQFHKGWYENEIGRSKRILTDEPPQNWQQTLQKI